MDFPIKPYLNWANSLGNQAWPVLAATDGSFHPVSAYLPMLQEVPWQLDFETSLMRTLLDARMIVTAAQTIHLGPEVHTLVDYNAGVFGHTFQSLWDIRTQLREALPVMPNVTSYMLQIRQLPWNQQLDAACLIRSMAAAPPLIIGIEQVDEASDDVQRQILSLVDTARKWVVLDGLALGVLLGLGTHPIRCMGLRKLLKVGVCPRHEPSGS